MAGGALFLAAGLLTWLIVERKGTTHTVRVTQSSSEVAAATQGPGEGAPTLTAPEQREKASAGDAAAHGSSQPLTPDFDDRIADSPEEAEWLKAHGYPNLSEIEFMDSLSLDQLSDLARAGNRMAQVFLGTRLALAEKDFGGGVKTLESTAVNGSVYALTALASVHEASGNLALAQGYRVAALLRGDYETVFVHNVINNFSNAASPQWELSLGFPAGQAIIDRLNQARVAQGMDVLPPAIPRPGAEAAYQRALLELERLAKESAETGQSKSSNSQNGG